MCRLTCIQRFQIILFNLHMFRVNNNLTIIDIVKFKQCCQNDQNAVTITDRKGLISISNPAKSYNSITTTYTKCTNNFDKIGMIKWTFCFKFQSYGIIELQDYITTSTPPHHTQNPPKKPTVNLMQTFFILLKFALQWVRCSVCTAY